MAIGRQDLEAEANKLLADKTWKGHLILGIIALILGGVVSSPVFTFVRALIELILFVGGLGLVGWALYQYYKSKEQK